MNRISKIDLLFQWLTQLLLICLKCRALQFVCLSCAPIPVQTSNSSLVVVEFCLSFPPCNPDKFFLQLLSTPVSASRPFCYLQFNPGLYAVIQSLRWFAKQFLAEWNDFHFENKNVAKPFQEPKKIEKGWNILNTNKN